jgi:hypothetical protein
MGDANTYAKTGVSEVVVDDRGFVKLTFPTNVEIDYKQAYEIYISRLHLEIKSPQLLLVDLRSNPRPDREARQFAKSDEVVDITKAMACVVDGLLGKMVGNLLMSVTTDRFPAKLFTSEQEAIDWLLDFDN